MSICNIFYNKVSKCVVLSKLIKGFVMSEMIKNAETLLERVEKTIEIWASKVF